MSQDQCEGLDLNQCRQNSDCLFWQLDTLTIFSKCISTTECNKIANTQILGETCQCNNAGWNYQAQKCECGKNTTPRTIKSFYNNEDTDPDCLPIGSCANDTEMLTQNIPTSDVCGCIDNAEIDQEYYDNGGSDCKCKCKSGFVISKNKTRCVIPGSEPDDSTDKTDPSNPATPDKDSKASPTLVVFLTCLIIASIAACVAAVVRVRTVTKKRMNNDDMKKASIY